MFASSKTQDISKENYIFDFIKGLIVSILLSLALVVGFALCLKWFNIDEKTILPVTFGIKYVSVIVGSIVGVKGENKGLLKGGLFGLVYSLLSFVVFSILSNSFIFDLTSLLDVVSAILLGGIVGIIKVNRK